MNSSTEQFQNRVHTIINDFRRLPFVIKLVLFFVTVIFAWNYPVLGINMSGIAWVLPLAFSLLFLTLNLDKVSFPYSLWIPWVLLLFAYLFFVEWSQIDPRVVPQQRTMQLLSPLAVGMAVSTWRPGTEELNVFFATFRRFVWLLLIIVLFKTGVLLTGALPVATALAPEAITVTLLCTLFVASYVVNRSKYDLILWFLMVCVPFIALTRTAIAVSMLTFPLTFAPLPLIRRIIAVLIIAFVALAAFNTERVQNKMFYSGSGTLEDIVSDNDNFVTSGRKYAWGKMKERIEDEKWLGYGTGMGETFNYKITLHSPYPHNDWLLTMYDYGVLGVVTYALCCLMTVVHALLQLKNCTENNTRILFLSGAGGFMPLVMMMFTDNIMVYAPYFGNLHFILLGVAYAAIRAGQEEPQLPLVPSESDTMSKPAQKIKRPLFRV